MSRDSLIVVGDSVVLGDTYDSGKTIRVPNMKAFFAAVTNADAHIRFAKPVSGAGEPDWQDSIPLPAGSNTSWDAMALPDGLALAQLKNKVAGVTATVTYHGYGK